MIVCIGRQLASGGRQIAHLLGSRWGIPVYDHALITEAARQSGISEVHFTRADEQTHYARASRWLSSHVPLFFGAVGANQGLTNQALFQLQSDTIRSLAEQGDCIFVGRCADYILRDRDDLFSVFITANTADRLSRVMTSENITQEQAQKRLKYVDEQRAAYYNFYSGNTWGAASTYDLCLNSSVMGIEKSADFIAYFVSQANK